MKDTNHPETEAADSSAKADHIGEVTRGRFDATVQFNRVICREHFLLRLRIHDVFPTTLPGQFVQLGCRPPDTVIDSNQLLGQARQWENRMRPPLAQPELCGQLGLLRRPFSIADRGDDAQGAWIEVIHRVVGVGTAWLAHLKSGDQVDLIGPLGNSFTLPPDRSIGLLVGGGVGLPPMFYLAGAMHRARWRALGFAGAVTRGLLAVSFVDGVEPDPTGRPVASVQEYAKYGFDTVVTTDDGSAGLRGQITSGLTCYLESMPAQEVDQTMVYTCGPEPMMHAVVKLAASYGVDSQVCLEQAMACGMGTCQSCVVRILERQNPQGVTELGQPWRYRLACSDGPVFPAQKVVW